MSDVVEVASALNALGCYELSLGDTIGTGTPTKARDLVRAISGVAPVERIAAHFHDTYGQALANLLSAFGEGVRVVDAAAGGSGAAPTQRAQVTTSRRRPSFTCCTVWAFGRMSTLSSCWMQSISLQASLAESCVRTFTELSERECARQSTIGQSARGIGARNAKSQARYSHCARE